MLLKLCVLLGVFDVYFEHVRFAHRALTRPFPSSSSTPELGEGLMGRVAEQTRARTGRFFACPSVDASIRAACAAAPRTGRGRPRAFRAPLASRSQLVHGSSRGAASAPAVSGACPLELSVSSASARSSRSRTGCWRLF